MPDLISPFAEGFHYRPPVTQEFEFFWKGLREHRLLVQQCTSCAMRRHPPEALCPNCRSLEWETAEIGGRGSVYSYTIHHHPPIPPFPLPHVVALVKMDEGIRLVGAVYGSDPESVAIGDRVQLAFLNVASDFALHCFRPVAS